MAKPSDRRPHAVLVSYPLQGHLIPAARLAAKLAARGLTVTFVATESIHRQASLAAASGGGDIFADARASGLDIRYEVVSDGLPADFDRSLNHDQFMASLLHVLSAHVDALLRRLSVAGDAPPPTSLVADTFFVWVEPLARKFGLQHVSFWTEPALVFSIYYHMDLLRAHGHFGSIENREDPITYIPGVASMDPSELMSYLQDSDTSTVVHQIIFKAFQGAQTADAVVCNTVEELEPATIAALDKPFFSVGPLLDTTATSSSIPTSLWPETDCRRWLDPRPPSTVLYISFGSYAHLTLPDLHEIAGGVADSGVPFLWVLRPDIVSSDDPRPLPAGFEGETEGRGLVVQWCRQTEVLSHPAVGGFFTHCGWNSILESSWCGVPMLCFPLLTDQFTNRKLVVGDWKAGIDAGSSRGRVSRRNVAERISGLMGGTAGRDARMKAEELRTKLKAATAAGGSSEKNLDRFMEFLGCH